MYARIAIVLAAAMAFGVAGCDKRDTDDRGGKTPTTLPSAWPSTNPATGPDARSTPLAVSHLPMAPSPVKVDLKEPGAATDAMDDAHLAAAKKMINDGITSLLAAREADGGWSMGGAHRPAMTALVLKALMGHGQFTMDSHVIKKGYAVLLSFKQKDGGIYDPAQGLSTYTTAVAISSLVAAGNPAFKGDIDDAVNYLKKTQIQPGSESPDGPAIKEGDPRVGGMDYGKSGQPNLSTLGFAIEGWHDAGVPADDPAMQRAVAFLQQVQNNSENDKNPAVKVGARDGGFFYAPNESKAGTAGAEGKGLRSYGSMTYVGFKSLLFAGIDRTDPRVQGALKWIRDYWRLDSNPNMPQAQSLEGLYYYYLAYAKALHAWGEPKIKDAAGKEHNWREELVDAFKDRQSGDGSWVNRADRWNEASPVLVTAYAVIALEETLKK
jgi:squalene-hopene/tetraprenyl-beta-curcumene cyclase